MKNLFDWHPQNLITSVWGGGGGIHQVLQVDPLKKMSLFCDVLHGYHSTEITFYLYNGPGNKCETEVHLNPGWN